MPRALKKPQRMKRARQYRVLAERLAVDLSREDLPEQEAHLVRTAQEALASAGRLMEEIERGAKLRSA